MERIITVFGSGFTTSDDKLYYEAQIAGKILANNGFTVCTGGYYGIMEAVSKGAKSVNGKTIGIIVDPALNTGWKSEPNNYIDEIVKMPNLMERLTELIAIGDTYLIFKGGTGTLVELSVALELMNKKVMKEKKLIIFNSFWEHIVNLLKQDTAQLSELIERCIVFADINNLETIIKTI